MERSNAQKKPKKRKKSSSKPQQKQTQKQSVVVNISQAKQQQRKKKSSKAKATPMPSSQQQLVQQQPLQQPPFIYATPPPVVNPLNPRVSVPTQERPLNPLQLEPPAVVKPTARPTLDEQAKISRESAEFVAKLKADAKAKAQREEAMIAKQLAFNMAQPQVAQPTTMKRASSAPLAEAKAMSPLAPPKPPMSPLVSAEDRQLADRLMRPMEAEPRPPRKKKSSPPAFTFGGSQFQEEPPLDRYLGFSRKEGAEPKLLVQRATQTPLATAVATSRIGDEDYEPTALGLTAPQYY